jgi:N-sulfoglucosamine sulfohydrolase
MSPSDHDLPNRRVSRRAFVAAALSGLALPHIATAARARGGGIPYEVKNRFNILLITVDDMDWESTGLFNPKNEHITPNINQLGRDGIYFENSHVPIAECWPSRTAIYTGRLPHRNGATVFKQGDGEVIALPQILRSAGYRIGLAGKTNHTLPGRHALFDTIYHKPEIQFGRSPKAFYDVTGDFLRAAKAAGQPFFLNLNLHDPHRPFAGSPDDRDMLVQFRSFAGKLDPFDLDVLKVRQVGERIYQPSEVYVPGFLPDIDEVREELSYYYSSVHRADQSVGLIMQALRESGHADDTMVVFLSDNGIHMPFAKGNVYRHSTAASMIFWFPRLVAGSGLDRAHFVSSIDLFPTILDILGADPIGYLDGKSLLEILQGKTDDSKGEIFTYRHQYSMRALHDSKYTYIYNLWSDGVRKFQQFFNNNPSGRAMLAHSKSDIKSAARYKHLMYREKEELYSFSQDRHSLTNLVENTEFNDVLTGMRQRMYKQMRKTDDNITYQFEREVLA